MQHITDSATIHYLMLPQSRCFSVQSTGARTAGIHSALQECFKVREGIIGYTVNGEDQQLRAGDAEVCHPPGGLVSRPLPYTAGNANAARCGIRN